MEIRGRTAVVSGGASGIGRAICLALARKGANIVVADIDEAGGEETVRLVGEAGAQAAFRRCDVTKTEDLEGTFAFALERFGSLDIVCNNAGIGERQDLFEDETREFERVIAIDLTAVIDATRLAVRAMRARGGGVIVNTASMGGLLPMPNNPVYAAAKAGVVNFTRSLAHLREQWNIRVNAICPSYTDTPLVRQAGEERVKEVAAILGGILDPDFVAEGVVELVEDDSRAGAIMRVTVQKGRDYAKEVRPF